MERQRFLQYRVHWLNGWCWSKSSRSSLQKPQEKGGENGKNGREGPKIDEKGEEEGGDFGFNEGGGGFSLRPESWGQGRSFGGKSFSRSGRV